MSTEQILVIENQYFGCVNWIYDLFQFSHVKIEQCEYYQKMSFRNRCVVFGANGLVQLSVPLQDGRNQRKPLKEVLINNQEHWQKMHWRTLCSCYGKAPFFEYYQPWLQDFYQKRFDGLWEMNLYILDWLKKVLAIPSEIGFTESYEKTYPSSVIDHRSLWLPKNFQDSEKVIRYQQVFEDKRGFQKNLSVLDILMCEGPDAKRIFFSKV